MKISQLKRLIPYAHKANVTLMVWGHHGVGKSQSIRQYADEIGYQFIDVRVGQMDVGDLLGLADFGLDAEGNKATTKFMPPNWFPRDPNGKYVLFLDELFRGRPDVQQALFQLVLDRRLHEMQLPKDCILITANNPDSDDYKTEEMQDAALWDRFLHVKLTPTNDEFFAYAKSKSFDIELLNFLQTNEDVLSNSKLKDFTVDVKPSKRSWDTVARLLKSGLETTDELFIEAIGGMVGIENASRLRAYIEQNRSKPFTGAEILSNYQEHREQLVAYCDLVSGRHDIVNITANNLTDFLWDKETLTKKEAKNLNDFIDDLPLDIGYAFYVNTMDAVKDGKQMPAAVNKVLDDNKKWDDIILNKKFLGVVTPAGSTDVK